MGLLDKMDEKLDRLEEKVEQLEEEVEHVKDVGPFDEELDPKNPFTTAQVIMFALGNLIIVGGVAVLTHFMLKGLAAILALIFTLGTFMMAGVAMLLSQHKSHKITGAIICATNILIMLWLWKG